LYGRDIEHKKNTTRTREQAQRRTVDIKQNKTKQNKPTNHSTFVFHFISHINERTIINRCFRQETEQTNLKQTSIHQTSNK
jgi:hypothetical protein